MHNSTCRQHPHILAAGGLQKIELLLPGFTACCKEQGAYIMGEDGHINETMMQAVSCNLSTLYYASLAVDPLDISYIC